jgi:hypothetical protein
MPPRFFVRFRVAGATPPCKRDAPMKRVFGPQQFRDGRVRVYGCSPGWILIWILISLILTIILNLLLNLIF